MLPNYAQARLQVWSEISWYKSSSIPPSLLCVEVAPQSYRRFIPARVLASLASMSVVRAQPSFSFAKRTSGLRRDLPWLTNQGLPSLISDVLGNHDHRAVCGGRGQLVTKRTASMKR
jgi:hypothetical protein